MGLSPVVLKESGPITISQGHIDNWVHMAAFSLSICRARVKLSLLALQSSACHAQQPPRREASPTEEERRQCVYRSESQSCDITRSAGREDANLT